MLRRTLIAAAVAPVAALPAAAPAYPPITCKRITVQGQSYIVRTHGPASSKAIAWSRTFIAKHRAPTGFTCKAYSAAVPAQCVRKGHKNTSFGATK